MDDPLVAAWDLEDPEASFRKAIASFAARLGLPDGLMDRAWASLPVIRGTNKFDLLWVDDWGQNRALAAGDYRAIAAAGAGLHVWPTGDFDLARVAEYLDAGGVGLWLEGSAAQYRSWGIVETSPSLQVLRVQGKARERVDLARISSLKVLNARGWSWRSGLAAPRLEWLSFESSSGKELPAVQGHLKHLIVNVGRSLERIDAFGDLSSLVHCSLAGGGRLDLRGLEAAVSLQFLLFEDFLAVENAQVLLELPVLKRLDFDAVREVDPVMSLVGLAVEQFFVFTNYAFGPEFLRAAQEENKLWGIDRLRATAPGAEKGLLSEQDFERLPESRGQWGVRFDNWDAARRRFKVRDDSVDSTLVELVFDELIENSWRARVEFDSEGDFVAAYFGSRADSDEIVRAWIAGWNDDAVLRAALRKARLRIQD